MGNNRKFQCWAYVRGYGVTPSVLIRQMAELLKEADRQGYTVVGASQESSSGKNLRRMGLIEALRAIRRGYANSIFTYNVLHLSADKFVLLRVLEIIQDNHAVLICAAEDTYTRLHEMGLSQELYQRSFSLGLGVPWIEVNGDDGGDAVPTL